MYGVILHSLYIVPIGAGLAVGYSKFTEEALNRQRVYALYNTNRATAAELEKKNKPDMQKLNWHRDLASSDQYAKIGSLLNDAETEAGSALKREKFRKEPALKQFSPDTQAMGEDYGIGFTGRYGALQAAALNLELHRPNMLLTSMTLTAPAATSERTAPPLLTADTTYLTFIVDQTK